MKQLILNISILILAQFSRIHAQTDVNAHRRPIDKTKLEIHANMREGNPIRRDYHHDRVDRLERRQERLSRLDRRPEKRERDSRIGERREIDRSRREAIHDRTRNRRD